MSWNHRVIRYVNGDLGSDYLRIHEVYYNDENVPVAMAEDGAKVGSDTIEGCREVLAWMMQALAHPTIDATYFESDECKVAAKKWLEGECK